MGSGVSVVFLSSIVGGVSVVFLSPGVGGVPESDATLDSDGTFPSAPSIMDRICSAVPYRTARNANPTSTLYL
jgi:hypothetical protein